MTAKKKRKKTKKIRNIGHPAKYLSHQQLRKLRPSAAKEMFHPSKYWRK